MIKTNRIMEKEIKISECYHSCTFFGNSMDGMQCNHPYWKGKGAYENMIITQDNSRDGKIPEKCPLKNEQLTIVYKLEIDEPNKVDRFVGVLNKQFGYNGFEPIEVGSKVFENDNCYYFFMIPSGENKTPVKQKFNKETLNKCITYNKK